MHAVPHPGSVNERGLVRPRVADQPAGKPRRKLPKDAVWGAGAGDQLLLVVPSLSLIMVRNGDTLAPGPGEPPIPQDDVFTKYHDYRARILFEPLAEAVSDGAQPTPQ